MLSLAQFLNNFSLQTYFISLLGDFQCSKKAVLRLLHEIFERDCRINFTLSKTFWQIDKSYSQFELTSPVLSQMPFVFTFEKRV
jgi:hypothetical protein